MPFKKKILIIGGSGFLGNEIANEFYRSGFETLIADKNRPPKKNDKIKFFKIDIQNENDLKKIIKKDMIVVHAAGVSSIEEAYKNPKKTINLNIVGSYNVIKISCLKKISRLIFTSSIYVQSNKGSFYRLSKQAVESMIEVFNEKKKLPYTIIRYGSLYGLTSQKWNFIKKLMLSLKNKKKIKSLYPKNLKRNYIHVNDAAKLTVKCISKTYLNKSVLITGKKRYLISDVIRYIQNYYNIKKAKVYSKSNKSDHYSDSPKTFRYSDHEVIYPHKPKSLYDEIKKMDKAINQKKTKVYFQV